MTENPRDPSRAVETARGWVECTTEYDWEEIPASVQAVMVEAAETFDRWLAPTVVTIKPAGIPDRELERFLEER